MPLAYLYWLLYIIWVIFALAEPIWEPTPPVTLRRWVEFIILAVLLFVLGWGVFGFVVK